MAETAMRMARGERRVVACRRKNILGADRVLSKLRAESYWVANEFIRREARRFGSYRFGSDAMDRVERTLAAVILTEMLSNSFGPLDPSKY